MQLVDRDISPWDPRYGLLVLRIVFSPVRSLMRRIRSVIREFHHSVVLTGIISAPPRDFLSVLERNRMRKERSRKVAQQRVLPLKCITRAHQILLVAFSNIYISSQKDWWSPLKTDRIRAVHIFVSLHAMHNYARRHLQPHWSGVANPSAEFRAIQQIDWWGWVFFLLTHRSTSSYRFVTQLRTYSTAGCFFCGHWWLAARAFQIVVRRLPID